MATDFVITAPGNLTCGEPKPGGQMTVSWDASVDSEGAEGDSTVYTVEHSFDGAPFVESGQTTGLSLPVTLPPAIRPGDAITVSWEEGLGASGYAIQRSIDNGVTWQDLATVTGEKTLTYTDYAPDDSAPTLPTAYGSIMRLKYRVASLRGAEVSTDYTESATVNVYIREGS